MFKRVKEDARGDEVRTHGDLISYVVYFTGVTMMRLGSNEILCLFHVQGVAAGSGTSAGRRNRRKRRKPGNVLYLRTRAYSPWNKDARRGCEKDVVRTPKECRETTQAKITASGALPDSVYSAGITAAREMRRAREIHVR